MVKRNIKIVAALALAISLSAGTANVHAAVQAGNPAASSSTKVEHKMKGNRKCGTRPIYTVLENKLGYTEAQIEDAAKSGKTAFELAKQKGISEDQLRSMIVDAQSQKIDQMVSKGRITKDKAATMKADLKTNIQKWKGGLMQKKHGFNPAYSILEGKLGFTKEQIDDAAKSGKTAFDLAKQKGVSESQLRSMIIDGKSQKIDKKVSEGRITKDKADAMKANLKTRIQKWNGCLDCK